MRRAQGIGTLLMQDALQEAGKQGYQQVRLCQDSFNMRSLALYSSLGFDVKEPLAYLTLSDKGPVDAQLPSSHARRLRRDGRALPRGLPDQP